MQNPWANVWSITEQDANTTILASPGDLFVFKATENSGSGYLWDVSSEESLDLELISDNRLQIGGRQRPGSPQQRRVVFQASNPCRGSMRLVHKRPWAPTDQLSQFEVYISSEEKQSLGPHINERTALLSA